MFKVWVHAWERRLHVRILRCPEGEVNAQTLVEKWSCSLHVTVIVCQMHQSVVSEGVMPAAQPGRSSRVICGGYATIMRRKA
jgi:hypothetical protein